MNPMVVRQSDVIVGRDDELGRLDNAVLATIASGRPEVVLISGEAGIGKSRLAAEMCRRACARGGAAMVGRCIALGATILPAAALRDLAIDLLERCVDDIDIAERRTLEGLLPGHVHDDGPAPTADHLIASLCSGLRRVAAEQPLVLLIEDVHWADETTRRLTAAVTTAHWLGPITVVVTVRSDELHRQHPCLSMIDEIVRARPTRVELGPLDDADVERLVSELCPDEEERPDVHRLLRRTNGNPFFIEELVGAGSAPVSDTLRGVLLARVAHLDDAAERTLQAIALAGEIEPVTLGRACALDSDHLSAVLDDLDGTGLLSMTHDRIEFRHDLSREVFADLAAGRRAELHRALAEALEQRYESPPGQIAHHWMAAHDLPRTLVASIAAGHAANRVGAATEALDHFATAVDVWDAVDAPEALTGTDRSQLLLFAAEAALHADRLDEGIRFAEDGLEALRPGERHRRVAILLRLRDLYRYNHRPAARARVVTELLDLVPAEPPSRERALVLTFAALERYYGGADGSGLADEAISVAEACGDLEALVEARSIATIWLPTSEQLAHAEATVAMCDGTVAPEHVLRAYNTLAISQALQGRMRGYTATATRGAELARRSGLASAHGPNMSHYSIMGNFWIGDWDRALEIAATTGYRVGHESALVIDQIRLRRGEDIDRPGLAGSLELQLDTIAMDEEIGMWLDARLELRLERNVDEVLEITQRALARPGSNSVVSSSSTGFRLVDILDAAIRRLADIVDELPVDQRDAARERALTGTAPWLDELSRLVRPSARPTELATRARIFAERDRLSGTPNATAWADVADTYQRMGMPYDEAVARLRTAEAELCGVDGRTVVAHERAAVHAARAAELAAGLRARPLLGHIERLQRSAHLAAAQLSTSREDSGTSHGVVDSFGLTEREREILTLVAEGRSNGEIGSELYISTKTASSHVSNILRKLGVANRTEAATAAQRHGLIGDRRA